MRMSSRNFPVRSVVLPANKRRLTPSQADLTALSLHRVRLSRHLDPVFHTVTNLTCDSVYPGCANLSWFLSPATFPSLELLAVDASAIYDDAEDYGTCTLDYELLDQLVCFAGLPLADFDHEHFTKQSPPQLLVGTITQLADLIDPEDTFGAIPYCRIRSLNDTTHSAEAAQKLEELEKAVDGLETGKYALSCISFPATLDPTSLRRYSTLWTTMRALARACKRRGIEVIFEEGEKEHGGSFLPVSLVAYAKKRRAEQQKKQVEGKRAVLGAPVSPCCFAKRGLQDCHYER
jgi:hypothetical protein